LGVDSILISLVEGTNGQQRLIIAKDKAVKRIAKANKKS